MNVFRELLNELHVAVVLPEIVGMISETKETNPVSNNSLLTSQIQ